MALGAHGQIFSRAAGLFAAQRIEPCRKQQERLVNPCAGRAFSPFALGPRGIKRHARTCTRLYPKLRQLRLQPPTDDGCCRQLVRLRVIPLLELPIPRPLLWWQDGACLGDR